VRTFRTASLDEYRSTVSVQNSWMQRGFLFVYDLSVVDRPEDITEMRGVLHEWGKGRIVETQFAWGNVWVAIYDTAVAMEFKLRFC